uniref:Rhodanese domain-containing protein n=1 Tax=Strombidium inclinatum TaxID=197538 RepID=A0A7S3MV81_9SPIT|mmetsp:Transcript_1899/g.2652  ORF Transcript_1899/g.2652 Transcript_1899/m.2652 type:complete len:152 (+) Transcript_1899:388-843(+)|eukprot:CAMPEP_0170484750 /NCGR_PEP_ID=MMETSP0208-20121228/4149_1 /TAXON_ID=197538 /ORGANISM="Strombidium inclinatum, Strain S3" /LENGTH=151 /DNA_ID=CAMNT_0010758169 /DNA_START=391 /DNA_END=846 /DNA_ORIENTATION=-
MTSVSAVTYATEQLGLTDQTTFLLLDLRDPEDYDFWRIKDSINYPAANIARDKIIPELYRFKNKADKLIIVYMNDERKGTQAANLLTEKGYDNVFLLSGGIEQFNEEFHKMVEGRNVPRPRRQIEEEEQRKKMEKSQQIKMRSQQKKMDKF